MTLARARAGGSRRDLERRRSGVPVKVCRSAGGPRLLTLVLIGFQAPQALVAQAGLGHVFSANLSDGHISRHDPVTGESLGTFVPGGSGGLAGATGIAFGPNGGLFVASSATDQILEFDGETGEFIAPFVTDSVLHRPFSLIFGPDGDLYVSSGSDHRVLRFDGSTGDFVAIVAEGLRVPIGLRFGPDGGLYVANSGADQIVRIAPDDRSPEVFIDHDLRFPSDLVFSDDGGLFVTSAATGQVLEFDPGTGRYVREVARLPEGSAPVGIDVALDGDLVVADFARSRLFKVDRASGDLTMMEGDLAGPENIVVKRRDD